MAEWQAVYCCDFLVSRNAHLYHLHTVQNITSFTQSPLSTSTESSMFFPSILELIYQTLRPAYQLLSVSLRSHASPHFNASWVVSPHCSPGHVNHRSQQEMIESASVIGSKIDGNDDDDLVEVEKGEWVKELTQSFFPTFSPQTSFPTAAHRAAIHSEERTICCRLFVLV